jgi:hypothetical protein
MVFETRHTGGLHANQAKAFCVYNSYLTGSFYVNYSSDLLMLIQDGRSL